MKKLSVAPQPSYPRFSQNPQDEHAFWELGSRRFEQFARALHAAQPDILSTNLYGPDGQEQFGADHIVICPLLSGPKLMIFWITKENMNAGQEASPGRDYRQAA